MGRNAKNSRKTVEMKAKKTKRRKNFEKHDGNFELRRSGRVTSNVFASRRITNKRLTVLPLGFFSNGIKSAVAKKTANGDGFGERNKLILSEDLHALLQDFDRGRENGFARDTPPREDFAAGVSRGRQDRHRNYDNASNYFLELSSRNREENGEKSRGNSAAASEDITYRSSGFSPEGNFESVSNRDYTRKLDFQTKFSILNSQLGTQSLSHEFEDFANLTTNYKFSAKLHAQLKVNYQSHKKEYLLRVKLSARKIDDIFDGKVLPDCPESPEMSTKRFHGETYENVPEIPLVPQSQWVYSTPDKQNMKTFVFEEPQDNSDKIVPAVLHRSSNNKILYDIKNELIQNVNLLRYKDENIPIDKRYLNPICKTTNEEIGNVKKKPRLSDEKENVFTFAKPNPFAKTTFAIPQPSTSFFVSKASEFKFQPKKEDFNVFLSNAEETIDIKQMIVTDETNTTKEIAMEISVGEATAKEEHSVTFNVEEERYAKAPKDYRHQLLMATQRPSKTTKKIPKRHMLKAKSLSFENTPPRGKVLSFEPKKLELEKTLDEECLEQFEKEFNILGESSSSVPSTSLSGLVQSPIFSNFAVPTFKFYPRRNYDLN